MPGIAPHIHQQLQNALIRSEYFDNTASLRVLFVDNRIAQWEGYVPDVSINRKERVSLFINTFYDFYNEKRENALFLFLIVLADRYDISDDFHHNLLDVAFDLSSSLSSALGPMEEPAQARKDDWEKALDGYRVYVRQAYDSVQIFGQPSPVPLQEIYTDLYLLDRPTALIDRRIDDFQRDPDLLNRMSRHPAEDILKSSLGHRLLIVGKPGAGKTTFLKYVALQAVNDPAGKIPFYVNLKEWADAGYTNFQAYLIEQLTNCNFLSPADYFRYLFASRHNTIVLLDALDEVRSEGDQVRNAVRAIETFARTYPQVQILVTCRLAAVDYTFPGFTRVEVADFTWRQVENFVKNWFQSQPSKSVHFLRDIRRDENRGLRELARQPLLLTMLCLAFEGTFSFPPRRADLYAAALDALLTRWDATRDIRRSDIYKNLSVDRKHQLFSEIAAPAFEKGHYFFPQGQLEKQIADFLDRLSHVDRHNSTDLNGAAVLRTIVSHHGILYECSRRIYTFAHLTFQEYYTAYHTVHIDSDPDAFPKLLSHVTDPHWYEVILLTASMLPQTRYFFIKFLEHLHTFLEDDPSLCAFLAWANRKADSIRTSWNPLAVRRFYIYLVCDQPRAFTFANAQFRDLAAAGTSNLEQILSINRDLVLDLMLTHAYAVASAPDLNGQPGDTSTRAEAYASSFARARSFAHDPKLTQTLAKLKAPKDPANTKAWRTLARNLRSAMMSCRDIGHAWDFTRQQTSTLKSYLTTADLLLQCLDLAIVEKDHRTAVEDFLFRPPPSKSVLDNLKRWFRIP